MQKNEWVRAPRFVTFALLLTAALITAPKALSHAADPVPPHFIEDKRVSALPPYLAMIDCRAPEKVLDPSRARRDEAPFFQILVDAWTVLDTQTWTIQTRSDVRYGLQGPFQRQLLSHDEFRFDIAKVREVTQPIQLNLKTGVTVELQLQTHVRRSMADYRLLATAHVPNRASIDLDCRLHKVGYHPWNLPRRAVGFPYAKPDQEWDYSFQGGAHQFLISNLIGRRVREVIIDDLKFIRGLRGGGASPLHREVFGGSVDGEHYLQLLMKRIFAMKMDGYNHETDSHTGCGPGPAVGCVDLLSKSGFLTLSQFGVYYLFSGDWRDPVRRATRLDLYFHESQHVYYDEARHRPCPDDLMGPDNKPLRSGISNTPLAGKYACDETLWGAYGFGAILLSNLSQYCTNCSEEFRRAAAEKADDCRRRILSEESRHILENQEEYSGFDPYRYGEPNPYALQWIRLVDASEMDYYFYLKLLERYRKVYENSGWGDGQ